MLQKKKTRWALIALVLIATIGGGYYYWASGSQKQEAEEEEVPTARVRRGDLTLAATGAGSLIPADEHSLSFDVGSTVTEVNVEAGDEVKAGDVLARTDDAHAHEALINAQSQATKADIDLHNTLLDHEDLLAGPTEADLLTAQAAAASAGERLATLTEGPEEAEIAAARADLLSAQENLNTLLNAPDSEEVERAQLALDKARNSLWSAQMSRDAKATPQDEASGAYDQAQATVLNNEISVRLAEMDLARAQEAASEAELTEVRAKVAAAEEKLADLQKVTEAEMLQARAEVAKAKEALADIEDGPSEEEMAISEAKVEQGRQNLEAAQLTLEQAQRDMEQGTVIVAPIDGTIMSVDVEVGKYVNAGTAVLTLADLSRPTIEFYVDETDVGKLAVGNDVEVVFDIMREKTFTGAVTYVDTRLRTVSNALVLRGEAVVEAGARTASAPMLVGMNATVDVIGDRAENALLVPVEALRDVGDEEYAVFVMKDGELQMRAVEVGIMDYTYAVVTSGLQEGDVVSTGLVRTQ